MNQSFLLKHHCGLSIFEQDWMTGEERKWWIERAQKEADKKSNQGHSSAPGKRSHIPGSPLS
jgi:hypothetical protein